MVMNEGVLLKFFPSYKFKWIDPGSVTRDFLPLQHVQFDIFVHKTLTNQ